MVKRSAVLGMALALALAAAGSGPAGAAPVLQYSPARFDVEVFAGSDASSRLTLRNAGDAPLELALGVRDGRFAPAGARGLLGTLGALRTPDDGPGPPFPQASGRSSEPWAAAAGPWMTQADAWLPPSRTSAAGLRVLILHCDGDVAALRTQLQAVPEFQAVDVWNMTFGVPRLADLAPYAGVYVTINTGRFEPDSAGNVLADYVDQGGGLVRSLAAFSTSYEVRGRLLFAHYMPFLLAGGPGTPAQLGPHDTSHPIMSGVLDVRGDLITSPPVAAGAEVLAAWAASRPFVAMLGRVAGLTLVTATAAYWTGDVPALIKNALLWSAGKSPWLRLPTTRATIARGAELTLDLSFVSAGLDAGAYESELVITSNDPDLAEARLQARFVVRGAPRMKLSGGEQSVESQGIFSSQGAETEHRLLVGSPPPDTVRLDLIVDGDYNDGGEYASVLVEGRFLGTAGPVMGPDCPTAFSTFTLLPFLVRSLVADGAIEVQVRNTPLVDPGCYTNLHTVRLRFERPADPMELDSVFVGSQGHATLLVRNVGSDVVHVQSFRSGGPAFVPERQALDVLPGHAEAVGIRFAPVALGDAPATLTVESDDPLTPSVEIHMRGFGLPPPDVDVPPGEIAADLPVGGHATRTVELQNHGGSPLTFHLRARSTVRARTRARLVAPPPDPQPSPGTALRSGEADEPLGPGGTSHVVDRRPRADERGAFRSPAVARTAMPGARVLIVEDVLPWGTLANETALSVEGVPFEVATIAQFDTTDLSRFALVILASDQTDFTYFALQERAERLEDFVGEGGVLEVHAAGWGNNHGDASHLVLPGGVTVVPASSDLNVVTLPDHPLAEGVPANIPGNATSHAWFSGLPPTAEVVARDDRGFPSLATYPLGRGLVVASGQTLEFAYAFQASAGPILVNMLRYSLDATPPWLRFEPRSGVIPAGASLPVTLDFDASGLDGGAYAAELLVLSDDPDEPVSEIPASLRVTGAPNLDVTGRIVVTESRTRYIISEALSTHRFTLTRPPGSVIAVVVDVAGDFGGIDEVASVSVEGFTLGTLGPMGRDCTTSQRTFVLSGGIAQQVLADGVMEVNVQNSRFVNPICEVNEHRVRVLHAESVFPVRFRDTFVGGCDQRGFVVRNTGSEPLVVRSITSDTGVLRPSPTSATLAPRQEQLVLVDFCPDAPGDVAGRITITTNDPDTPTRVVQLLARGIAAPELAVSESALALDLFTGGTVSRTLTVRNAGASPLDIRLLARAGAGAVPGPPGPAVVVEPGLPGNSGPNGIASALPTAVLPPLAASAQARVLIVEDLPPWGRLMDEALLDELGIPYDRVGSAGLASRDLTPYAVVLIAGDQLEDFYSRVSGQGGRLAEYLEKGGTLEVHAAGWGSYHGDATFLRLPGGVGVSYRLANVNNVLQPNHPMLADVPNPFAGTFASHGHLEGLPADALVLTTDEEGGATLAEYGFGLGRVIVATQPLEFGLARAEASGAILRRLVLYALGGAGGWLRATPDRDRFGPGSRLAVANDVEIAVLGPGSYEGEPSITSNAPRMSLLAVPVELRIANLAGTFRLQPRELSRDANGRPI